MELASRVLTSNEAVVDCSEEGGIHGYFLRDSAAFRGIWDAIAVTNHNRTLAQGTNIQLLKYSNVVMSLTL